MPRWNPVRARTASLCITRSRAGTPGYSTVPGLAGACPGPMYPSIGHGSLPYFVVLLSVANFNSGDVIKITPAAEVSRRATLPATTTTTSCTMTVAYMWWRGGAH